MGYEYGKDEALTVGTTYDSSGDGVCRYATLLPVKKYYSGYDLPCEITYLSYLESSTESLFAINNLMIRNGFMIWDDMLYDNFGFGMDKIGFSSY